GRGMSSLIIQNGQVLLDWTTDDRPAGKEAIARMGDGTFRMYRQSDGDTASSMVADGVVDAWGFGPIVLNEGVVRSISDDDYWGVFAANVKSARTIYGYAQNGDFIIIVVTGTSNSDYGIGGSTIGELAKTAGCYSAIVDDGGGSSQLYVNGAYERMSSDRGGISERRSVIELHDVDVSVAGSKWQDLILESGVRNRFENERAQVRVVDEGYEFRGTVEFDEGKIPGLNTTVQIASLPKTIPPPINYRDIATFGQSLAELCRLRLSHLGDIAISPMTENAGDFNVPRSVSLNAMSTFTVR